MDARNRSLAVVVLSVGSPIDLRGAVLSLIRQQPQPAEIVVVNSGGGDPSETLRALLPQRCVLTTSELMRHGAARNAGVAATSAQTVAFLSADCRAMPGWVAARQAAHDQGHAAVASAVVNRFPRSLVATAAHMALFSRRMPHTPPHERLMYGLSYERSILASCGGFREDLDGNEDAEFNHRLRVAGFEPVFCGDVRTAHPHPKEFGALMRDQARRGRRMAAFHRNEGTLPGRAVARDAITRVPADVSRALRSTPREEVGRVMAALPLVPVAALAYAAGAIGVGGTTYLTEEGAA